MIPKILFVDDEPHVLEGFQRALRKQFTLDVATDGFTALDLLKHRGPYGVLVADMRMPGMDGVQLLRKARDVAPDTVRLMLTGNADQQTAVDAVNQGHVFQFLNKPCSTERLVAALQNALRQYELVTAEKELLEKTLSGSVKVLADVLALADPTAFGAGQKLRDNMRAFAEAHQVPASWQLELAALLAHLGCITIPAPVLLKWRAGLTLLPAERAMLERIPETGAQLLANIPRLEPVARSVRYQEKNFDGTGRPADSVAGEAIPIGARLLRVFGALLEREAAGQSQTEALEQLRHTPGMCDPRVIESVAALFESVAPVSVPAAPKDKRAVKLADLQAGQVLAADVLTKDGVRVCRSGLTVTLLLLERLQNFAQLTELQEPIYVEG
jgi:response regulator RpfG family c-di-GMP phosphodiesterase